MNLAMTLATAGEAGRTDRPRPAPPRALHDTGPQQQQERHHELLWPGRSPTSAN
ncbi:MAG: hypothetical protein ACLUQ6_11240 [Alistipes onderdonkii]